MENVPDVIYKKNIKAFSEWLAKLESLGYKCYWKILNSKDYGIPQNRERCFMVSILGDYYYEFPEPIKLEKRLKDLLEKNIDEKYYLTKRAILGRARTKVKIFNFKNSLPKNGICSCLTATDYKRPKLVQFVKRRGGGQTYSEDYSWWQSLQDS